MAITFSGKIKYLPALAELEASGELLIAGAMYNIGTGKVDFL